MTWLRGSIGVALLSSSDPAFAHVPIAGVDGFPGGLLHPLLVPAHALALLGLGLLIGQQPAGPRLTPWLLFTLALVAGLGAIAFAVGETPANDLVLACAAVAGLLVALAGPFPPSISRATSWALATVAGAAIGLDSPPDVVSLELGIAMLIGTGLGASAALAAVIQCTTRLARDWQRIAVRIAGSWIAASAILVLALRLAR
jgi:urease accessory protein